MPRKVFYSFHFDNDSWRAAKVRNIRVLEGNSPVAPNQWEDVKRGGDAAIERWISGQMSGRSCAIVLVGSETASRPWVRYEIEKAWNDGLGVVGIRIHNLTDRLEHTAFPGRNPFDSFNIKGVPFSQIVTLYNPNGRDSPAVYADISGAVDQLVESAIRIRMKY